MAWDGDMHMINMGKESGKKALFISYDISHMNPMEWQVVLTEKGRHRETGGGGGGE